MAALNTVVFVCGACVMVIELVGSRLFAPYMGTSLFVWTSLIGVILGCLSLGYWAGGVFADKRPEPKILSALIFFSGLATAAVAWGGDRVLFWIQNTITDLRVASVVATLVLFGLPSVLLGMVSPFAVRLSLSQIERTGSTAGALYALSTLGSIAGTFLAGFFLLSFFSHRTILFIVSAILIGTSSLAAGSKPQRLRAMMAFFAVLGLSTTEPFVESVLGKSFIEQHTPYNRVWIYDAFVDSKPVRMLQLNDSTDSSMFTESDELVLEYTKYFRLGRHFRPDLKRSLMIGGGAYSFAKDDLRRAPDASMDVVEIDEKLTDLARRYFNLKEDPRLRVFHEDARTYLNRSGETYGAVYGDVYKSYTVPFHLTTREAMQKIHERLDADGMFVVNVIASVGGEKGRLLRAMLATMDPFFPEILVFAADDTEDPDEIQNLVVIGFKSRKKRSFTSEDPGMNKLLSHIWVRDIPRDMPVLTDALAPVERYTQPIIARADRRSGILQKTLQAREI